MNNTYGSKWPPKCRKCGRDVPKSIPKCPDCGAGNPDMSNLQRILYLLIPLVLVIFVLKTCSDNRASKPKLDPELVGAQCLSPWNGTHRAFNEEIKRKLRDPDSFKHVRTRVGPKMSSGSHRIFVDYRAKNGFGGVNSNTANGTFKASNCHHTLVSMK